MSKKNEILKGFDDYIEGKKYGKIAMYLVVFFSLIVVFGALIFSFCLQSKAIDVVKVIDSSGRKIESETKREQEILFSSIQTHMSNALYYLNSFDRGSIKENQARSLFLVDKKSADRIFNSYNTTGAYNDAIRNAYIYDTKFVKIIKLEGDSEPYSVEIEGELTITDGNRILKNKITGKGKLRYNTPSFPTNPQGFLLYDYLQNYEKISNKEEN
jgi:hypothetical protein